jgi:glycine/D-amino acid oxidase-like deaminating enzyme
MRPPATAQIAYFPAEGFVHGKQAVEALLERARSAGARLLPGTGDVTLDVSGGTVQAVRLPDGSRVHADVYVCCTGWRTPDLMRPHGVPVPLVPGDAPGSSAPCLVVSTDGPAPLRRVVHTPAVNVRPDWGGGVRLESGEVNELVDGRTAADELDRLGRVLLQRAEELLAGFSAAAVRRELCVRPLPVDGHPIVGWQPELRNAYLAVSHSGITLAPVLAELVAADILQRDAADLAPYRPDRFAEAGR